jgi:preprotein translocase subunit SecG
MTVLFVIQIFVVVMMIGVILMQKTTSDGLMAGSGSPDSFLSGRSSANVLTKTTAILATIFIINSLVMGYLASHSKREGSVLDEILGDSTTQPQLMLKVLLKALRHLRLSLQKHLLMQAQPLFR